MEHIKLGVIGLSEGNGHPYSWSAICNGYDVKAMQQCPFPVIPEYLEAQKWPDARLANVSVEAIWTQDSEISRKVAAAALIPTVCSRIGDLIGKVDAVLLARDDPEHHAAMAQPFLKAGLPVYIDKPMATTVAKAKEIMAMTNMESQVFSCSALRYARELHLTDEDRLVLGEIKHVDAVVPKSWEKYSIHVIEPALLILGEWASPLNFTSMSYDNRYMVNYTFSGGRSLQVTTMNSLRAPLQLRVFGTKGHRTLTFTETFPAFRESIRVFLEQVRSGKPQIPLAETLAIVHLIELGLKS